MIEELLKEFHVPAHIRRHSEKVAAICKFIEEKIDGVDLDLLEKAAMLHDLVRICDFTKWNPQNFPDKHTEENLRKWEEIRKNHKGKPHEEAAYEVLIERGEKEVAELIRSHRFKIILEPEPFKTWEEKILYYADKRVEHDQVVSLEERLDRGKERNAVTEEQKARSDEARPKIYALEKEICEAAGIKPEDLFLC